MMEDLKNQAERFGTEVRFGLVTKTELATELGGYHTLTIDDSLQVQARNYNHINRSFGEISGPSC